MPFLVSRQVEGRDTAMSQEFVIDIPKIHICEYCSSDTDTSSSFH